MHDCQKIEERLIDLVFNELREEERRRTLAEVEGCGHCRAEYQALASTLSAVDRASAAMLPEEEYWHTYEARLRARLAADERPPASSIWQRWRDGLQALTARPAWALSAALVLGLALFLFLLTRMSEHPQAPKQAEDRQETVQPPNDQPQEKQKEEIGRTPSRDEGEQQPDIRRLPNPPQKKESLRPKQWLAVRRDKAVKPVENVEQAIEGQASQVAANFESVSAGSALLDNETLKHFEKAQLFLRAFRNLDVGEKSPAFEIADEKQRSQALLFKNVLLRREAEAKGNLPVEQVLSDLEPLLLDIANLADRATAPEIRAIHERLQKREMIATLQIYAARPVIARAAPDE